MIEILEPLNCCLQNRCNALVIMRLYLDSNVANFGLVAEAKGFRLTHYVDGLTKTSCAQIEAWLSDLQTDGKSPVEEARQVVEHIHLGTECEWKGYHCFIGILNQHAALYFIPIGSPETPYNESGWHDYNVSSGVCILRMHLAYSAEDSTRFAVYIDERKSEVDKEFRLFLCCNILTSSKALEVLAYRTALQLGNYRELESDCLEFAKAAAKLAKQHFVTEREFNIVVDIDSLTVTSFKSEALSRRNPASRFSVLISMGSIQPLQTVFIAVLVMICYHFFIR